MDFRGNNSQIKENGKIIPKVKYNRAISFYQDITARKEKVERTKELNFLHNFARLLRKEDNNLEKILEGTVKLLPSSFQFPEDAGACITFKGHEFKTEDYVSTPWKISSELGMYGEHTGTIEVCYHKPPLHGRVPFLKEEQFVLETIAEHLSRVIEQIQAKEELEFEKLLAKVYSIFAIQTSEQLEESINLALKQISEFFQIERSYVFQFSNGGKQMSNTYERCAEGTEAQRDRIQNISVDAFPWWVAQIKNKKNVNIPDVDSLPPEAGAEKKEFKSQGIRSLLSIPMMKDEIVIGFLGFAAVKEKKTWTENQVILLTIVTELVSNAYTSKMAEVKVRYQSFHDGLTGLHNRVYLEDEMERLDTERQLPIGVIMADSNGLKLFNDAFGHEAGDKVLKQTAEILRKSCRGEDIIGRWGGDEFLILLPQTTEVELKVICQRIGEKCKETYVNGIPLSLAMGYAIKNSTNQVLVDILREAEKIMYKNKLAESQWVQSNVVESLLTNLEEKSFENNAHYSVMNTVAQRIGMKMGLSELELTRLEMLISLHDIGEVIISNEILNKKGPLTAEEWKIIKRHPETGYRIVHATEEFAHVAEDTLSHHERWDGLGYPQGLKGKEIPLLARITAVADAYEVMSSGRPYKKAMSWEEIEAELKRSSGFQFDPEIIGVFQEADGQMVR